MENSTENINQGRPVYFSYARNSSRKPEWEHISDCVDTLLNTLTANNLEYRVDVKDIGMGDKISKFEEEIGWNSEVVVIIFSDKYFRSMHCMYEFVQIKNALKQYPEKRLMCIKSGDFNLADFNYIMELEDYWNDQKKEYEKIEYHHLREHSGTEIAAHENGFYLDDIRKLYSFFSAINYSNAASINYDGFVGDIVKYYKTTRKPKLTPKPRVQQLTKTEQRTSSTSQPTTKKSPIVPIAIAAVIVVALVIYFMAGKTTTTETTTTKQTITTGNTDNNGDVATTKTETNESTTDISTENGDTIFNKADELFNAKNYLEAVVYFEELAKKGNVEAQAYAGECYYHLEDYEKAVELYQKAADQGNAHAQYGLGLCYFGGEGVPEDHKKAVVWFQKAANQGDADAQFWLGACYYKPFGVPEDHKKAAEWFQKAADQGNAEAQYGMGVCYQYGEGVPKDSKKAVEWYQKAAEQGYDEAQYYLGLCYKNGDGVPKDYKKAVEWLQKAADQENKHAIEALKEL